MSAGTIEIVTGADAQANVASLPANVIIYGPPGTLKTTDACTAFTSGGRCNAFVIPCEDGALKPLIARGLPIPDHPKQTVKSWGQLMGALDYLAKNVGRYSAAILDGFTPLSSYLYAEAEAQHKGSKNKFTIPTQVRTQLFTLREWLRQIGLHSVFIAHAMPPIVIDGVFSPGAFQISPKSIIREYFGQTDTVLRVDYLVVPGQAPMRVYYTGGDEWPAQLGALSMPPDWRAWLAKNREGCRYAIVHADLGAFLRARQPPYARLG